MRPGPLRAIALLLFGLQGCVPLVVVGGGIAAENKKKAQRADQDVTFRHYVENKRLLESLATLPCPSDEASFRTFLQESGKENERRNQMGTILMKEFSAKLQADAAAWQSKCRKADVPVPAQQPLPTPPAIDSGASVNGASILGPPDAILASAGPESPPLSRSGRPVRREHATAPLKRYQLTGLSKTPCLCVSGPAVPCLEEAQPQ